MPFTGVALPEPGADSGVACRENEDIGAGLFRKGDGVLLRLGPLLLGGGASQERPERSFMIDVVKLGSGIRYCVL